MSQSVRELLDAALELSTQEREELADLLAASLGESPPSTLHPDWGTELRRRVAEIDSGETQPVTWDEAQRQIQAQFGAGSQSNS